MKSITKHLEWSGEYNSKVKGERLFESDQVTPLRISSNNITFKVGSLKTSLSWVKSDLNELELVSSCTCEYYENHMEPCLHIWASIRRVEDPLDNIEDFLDKDEPIDEIYLSTHHEQNSHLSVFQYQDNIKAKLISDTTDESWQTDLDNLQRYLVDIPKAKDEEVIPSSSLWYEIEPYSGIQIYSNYKSINLSFHEATRLKNGLYGKLKRKTFGQHNISLGKYAHNNKYFDLIKGHLVFDHSRYASEASIPSKIATLTLNELSKSNRLFINSSRIESGSDIIGLKMSETKAKFQAQIIKVDDFWDLGGIFEIDSIAIEAQNAFLTTDLSYLIVDQTMYPTELGKLRTHCEYLVGYGNIKVPLKEIDKLKKVIKNTIGLEQTLLDNNFSIDKKCIKGAPRIELSINSKNPDLINLKLEFIYEGESHTPLSANDVRTNAQNNDLFFIKDIKFEQQILDAIEQNDKTLDIKHENYYSFDLELKDLNTFIEMASKLKIEVRTQGYKVKSYSTPNVTISSNSDWFEIKGSISFENEKTVSMPQIIKLKALDNNFLILGDGSIGVTPTKWIKRVTKIAQLSTKEENRFKFNRAQAMIFDFLLEDSQVQSDETYKEIIKSLKKFDKVKDVKCSKNFNGELREYQRDGLNWLNFLFEFGIGGCLADDMGLGKTIQVLAHLQRIQELNKKKCHLIVVPKSLMHNWKEESKKFTPNFKVLIYEGSKRQSHIDSFEEYDLVIMTYAVMRMDIKILKDYRFGYCVIDEAQNIKNTSTLVAKASYLIQSDYKLALTGTPIENSIKELFSIFKFLIPALLPKAYASGRVKSNEQSMSAILKGLIPFILRRTKEQVLKDLPQKVESYIYCDFEKEQAVIYKDMKKFYQQSLTKKIKTDDMNKSKIHILEALLRMRQISCHPGLVNEEYLKLESSKVKVLIENIVPLIQSKQKVLVFSQFTSFLKIIKDKLHEKNIETSYLDGQTTKRQNVIEDFKTNDKKSVFLISLKAGGVGLNLTEASYCFLVDPWWNPAIEAQAIDRIHRIGQKKKVFAYRLITRDSVEEKILKLQKSKLNVSDKIMATDQSFLKQLSKEDLSFLLN